MSSELAIRVEGLSKSYTVRHRRHDHVTLAQTALERLRHPLQRDEREEFWALRDVSFEIPKGEVVGIIGHNGAGKSTLLKLLTRITAPTEGRVDLWGRVGSLLEVGTGFHPELTGRENIYLNGSILGMHRKEIDNQFDAIVDFAGVEKFLDTPVKRYSSGMYVRLAFAIAAHLESEILLLDEVLAVGDNDFKRRCLDRIKTLAIDGRTILLVSHQMQLVLESSTRVALFESGRLLRMGGSREMIEEFEFAHRGNRHQPHIDAVSPTNRFIDLTARRAIVSSSEPKQFDFTVRSTDFESSTAYSRLEIIDPDFGHVAICNSPPIRTDASTKRSEIHGTFTLRSPWLRPGGYLVKISLVDELGYLVNRRAEATCTISVEADGAIHPAESKAAVDRVLADFDFRIV